MCVKSANAITTAPFETFKRVDIEVVFAVEGQLDHISPIANRIGPRVRPNIIATEVLLVRLIVFLVQFPLYVLCLDMQAVVMAGFHVVRPKEAKLDVGEVGKVGRLQYEVPVEFPEFARFVVQLSCQRVALLRVNCLIIYELIDDFIFRLANTTHVFCVIHRLNRCSLNCQSNQSMKKSFVVHRVKRNGVGR